MMSHKHDEIFEADWPQLRAVIFDIGGVLLRTHDYGPRHVWDARLGTTPGTVEELVFNSQMGTAAQLGRVTIDEHWANIGAHLALSPAETAALRRDFWAGDRFDRGLVDWIATLRPRYKLAVISNAFDDLRQVLTEEFGVGDLFPVITVSAEEGVMKPDAEIYRRTLERLGCRPEETVFIDDNRANIAGARRLGMGGILFTPTLDLPAVWPRPASQGPSVR